MTHARLCHFEILEVAIAQQFLKDQATGRIPNCRDQYELQMYPHSIPETAEAL